MFNNHEILNDDGKTKDVEKAVGKLGNDVEERLEIALENALEQAYSDIRGDVIDIATAEHIDIAALSNATSRLEMLDSFASLGVSGWLNELIIEHSANNLDIVGTPEYLQSLIINMADRALSAIVVNSDTLWEIATCSDLWESIDPQGLSGLEGACRAGAELESGRGGDEPETSR